RPDRFRQRDVRTRGLVNRLGRLRFRGPLGLELVQLGLVNYSPFSSRAVDSRAVDSGRVSHAGFHPTLLLSVAIISDLTAGIRSNKRHRTIHVRKSHSGPSADNGRMTS